MDAPTAATTKPTSAALYFGGTLSKTLSSPNEPRMTKVSNESIDAEPKTIAVSNLPNGLQGRTNVLFAADKNYECACRRYETIRPFLNSDRIHPTDKHEAAKKACVSDKSIERWFLKAKERRFEGLLTPETFGGKGKTRARYGTSDYGLVEPKLQEWIATQYLNDELLRKGNKKAAYKAFEVECWATGVKNIFGYRTFVRRLEKVDRQNMVEEKFGKLNQGLSFPSSVDISDVNLPLQSVQKDHHLCDIILVDERGEAVGRPRFTVNAQDTPLQKDYTI